MRTAMMAGAAAALLACAAQAQQEPGFQSPSGNIHCMFFGTGFAELRCDLLQRTPSFPRPADCEQDWGHAFVLLPDMPGTPVCAGDTTADPAHPVLPYGRSVSHVGFTCTSERSGVTCVNRRGHGFTLSRARQAVF